MAYKTYNDKNAVGAYRKHQPPPFASGLSLELVTLTQITIIGCNIVVYD